MFVAIVTVATFALFCLESVALRAMYGCREFSFLAKTTTLAMAGLLWVRRGAVSGAALAAGFSHGKSTPRHRWLAPFRSKKVLLGERSQYYSAFEL